MDAALPPLTASTLYLVATPIGNLEDITLRALRVLRECDVVAAEDTRHSGQLLKHFGIAKPLLSYFQFNEARRSEEIIERLRRGEKVALVTDAGSPGISDPGERVVKAAIAAGFRVEAVAGAVRARGRAHGERFADGGISFRRFPAAQIRPAAEQIGIAQTRCRHLGFLRIAVSHRKTAGRTERGFSRTRRGAGARADEEVRGISARQTGGASGNRRETQLERRVSWCWWAALW